MALKTIQFFQILGFVSKTLFPLYPCYFFPSFLLIQVYNKLVSLKNFPKFRVVPLPNKLYNILVENKSYSCDHFCFVSDEIFDKYELESDRNWLNVIFGSNQDDFNKTMQHRSSDIVETILSRQYTSVLVPVIAVPKCQRNCIFVSENCFQNWCIKNKMLDNQFLFVHLKRMAFNQNLPKLASRATVFLIKTPHELPFDVTDEIITNFFSTPRVLFRNHTYEIILNEELVGEALYSEYVHKFLVTGKLYLRCIHLEADNNQFENFAIVCNGATTLHQSTSVNYPISRQILDDYSFITACSWGLSKYYDYLKSCILPFVGNTFQIPSNNVSPSSNADDTTHLYSMTANRIFPTFLLQGHQGSGKKSLVRILANSLGFHLYAINCAEIISTSAPAQSETKLKKAMSRVSTCEPVIFTLNNFEFFGTDNEGNDDLRMITIFQNELKGIFGKERTYPVILIAIANEKIKKPIIQSQFLDIISIETLNKDERFNTLQWIFHKEIILQEIFNGCHENYTDIPLWNGLTMNSAKYQLQRHLRSEKKSLDLLESIADQTQGFNHGDLKMLFDNSTENLLQHREPGSLFQMESLLEADQFEKYVLQMKKAFSDSLGSPNVPKVRWSDIGGLSKLKEEIQASIGLPLKHMHLMGKDMRRSGILLYGPPGLCDFEKKFMLQ